MTADTTAPETYEMYGGLPLTSAYALPSDIVNAELGPKGLVDDTIERQIVAQCAVRTMAEHLLHRPIELTELDWLDEQTEAFVSSGYDFTAMIAGMIEDERYRTIH